MFLVIATARACATFLSLFGILKCLFIIIIIITIYDAVPGMLFGLDSAPNCLRCPHLLFQLTDNIVRLSLVNIDNLTIRLLINLMLS